MKLHYRCLPILDWGAKYSGKTFDALSVTCIVGKRAGNDVLGGAA
jgi:hypothetical protein